MNTPTLEKVLKILKNEIKKWEVPIVTQIAKTETSRKAALRGRLHLALPVEEATLAPIIVTQIAKTEIDPPFKVLISTIISLRTKDSVTKEASSRLFQKASTPQEMLRLDEAIIAKLIYPAGFYKTKAKNIKKVCEILIEKYDGKVPRDIDEIDKLPGVGRKTANLVATLGFGDYGICVDTHVHRISNRWGFIKTKTPDESELALRKKLPKKYWKTFNNILVTFGQNLCVPVSPWCSRCPIESCCEKVGLKRSR